MGIIASEKTTCDRQTDRQCYVIIQIPQTLFENSFWMPLKIESKIFTNCYLLQTITANTIYYSTKQLLKQADPFLFILISN